MIRSILLSVIASFIGICLFYSCTKEESDSSYPVIEGVLIDFESSLESDSVMYTNSIYQVTTSFSSQAELSSYSIQIWSALMTNSADTFTMKSSIVKPLPEGTSDSAVFNQSFQQVNIWGLKDTLVTVRTNVDIDPAIAVANRKTLPVLLGDYYLKVTVIDKYGHATKDSFLIKVDSVPPQSITNNIKRWK